MWLWFDNGWCWWCCNSMEKLKLWNVIFLIASAEEKCSSASNSNDVIGRQPYINISLYRLIVGDINQINCILINCAFTHTHTLHRVKHVRHFENTDTKIDFEQFVNVKCVFLPFKVYSPSHIHTLFIAFPLQQFCIYLNLKPIYLHTYTDTSHSTNSTMYRVF